MNNRRVEGVTAQAGRGDSFGKAVSYLLFGIACGLGLDLCAKELLIDYPLQQFVLIRSVLGIGIFVLISRWYGGLSSLKTARWGFHLLRAGLSSVAMFGFFFGLSQMPLVNALTLAFTAPLIVTALSAPVLGEHVGWRRWAAVVTGFGGVLLVLRPDTGLVSFASLSVLAAAAAYAGLALTARKLTATETTYSMATYAIAGPLGISLFTQPPDTAWPGMSDWVLFVAAGICSVGAWVGIVGGYRRASPAILAPFEYTALIGGAFFGYLFWGEVPDAWVVVGSAVIIGSGLYIVHREAGDVLSVRYLRSFTAGSAAAIARRLRPGKSA